MPLEQKNPQKLLNFSNHRPIPSSESIVVKKEEQDYDGMLHSLYNISDSEWSLDDDRPKKKGIKVQKRVEKKKIPNNYNGRLNYVSEAKPKGGSELFSTQRTAIPTETDAFELDLAGKDSFRYKTPQSRNIFTSNASTEPTRIFCEICHAVVRSSISYVRLGFWQQLFQSWQCCNGEKANSYEVVHSCPNCNIELERVNCRI